MIAFKTWRQLTEFPDIHPTLREIIRDLFHVWPDSVTFVVTDIGRTREEDEALGGSGIHSSGPPWRALDFRTRDVAPETRKDVAQFLNDRWIYDPERPEYEVCIIHDVGEGPHGHLQVHHNTDIA